MKNDDSLWIFIHPPRTGGNTIIEKIKEKFPDEVSLPSVDRYLKKIEKIDKSKIRFILGHATYYGIHKKFPEKKPRYFIILRDPAERLVSHYNAKMQHEKIKIPFGKWYKNQIKNEMVHFVDLKFKGSASSRIHIPEFLTPLIRKLSSKKKFYKGYKDISLFKGSGIDYKKTYIIQTIIFRLIGLTRKNDFKKLENAKKMLNECWFIGVVENSKRDYKFLLNSMGIKDAKYRDEGISKKIIKIDDKLRKKIYEDNPLDVELYKYALKLKQKKLKDLN